MGMLNFSLPFKNSTELALKRFVERSVNIKICKTIIDCALWALKSSSLFIFNFHIVFPYQSLSKDHFLIASIGMVWPGEMNKKNRDSDSSLLYRTGISEVIEAMQIDSLQDNCLNSFRSEHSWVQTIIFPSSKSMSLEKESTSTSTLECLSTFSTLVLVFSRSPQWVCFTNFENVFTNSYHFLLL